MSNQGDIELTKEKMLQAESALANYFRTTAHHGAAYDSEKANQLTIAVTIVREEFIEKLGNVSPSRVRPAHFGF